MINYNFRHFRMAGRQFPPHAECPAMYNVLRRQTHLLIGGATGSGKSVVLNGIVYSGLCANPGCAYFVLIDPKRVELSQYKLLPQVWMYAQAPEDIEQSLLLCVDEMEYRYTQMERQGCRMFRGSDHLYIIIDEFADIKLMCSKKTIDYIQRLAQLGRASGIHVVCASQRTTRDILDGRIKINFSSKLALHVPTKQDSRNIIDVSGAELLPKYGECLYISPDKAQVKKYIVPMVTETKINQLINYYM